MAFEYLNHIRDPLYPVGGNRDEQILIEFDGILHSEAEDIFYGMKDCIVLEAHGFHTYDRLLSYNNPEKVYEEIGYFRPRDLIKYLNDGNEIDDDEISTIIEYSKMNYDYSTYTFLNMLGALETLARTDYVKGITIVFTNHRESDAKFLAAMFDKELLTKKFSILESSTDTVIQDMEKEMLEAANKNIPYTTVITNEYQLIIDTLTDYRKYKTDTSFFLLRNHSQNMEQLIKGDSVYFNELYTDEITNIITGGFSDKNIPDLSNINFPAKAKFGRFSPTPFKTDSPVFMTFGDNQESEESSNHSKEE
mgnify:FL=1